LYNFLLIVKGLPPGNYYWIGKECWHAMKELLPRSGVQQFSLVYFILYWVLVIVLNLNVLNQDYYR